MSAGIEAVNVYTGRAMIESRTLFEARGLDTARFDNLMMSEKSVNLPCEDPVSNAVNAAKPLVDALTPEERGRIEAVVVGTESGLDFGKPLSAYVHDQLGLSRRCRSFEVKHACYGGTAALRTGLGLLASSAVPGAKALVIAADAGGEVTDMPYWEPSHGAGAVAMLLGEDPAVLALDPGAVGLHSFEVMDTCRPRADLAAGDSDVSLLAYLECLESSFTDYRDRVEGADLMTTFDYLAFHTPFAGMVKGAHRQLLRRAAKAGSAVIEEDFTRRLAPSLAWCSRMGNTYSAGLYVALCSLIEHGDFAAPRRIGLFSYGSGCTSEFFSGVVTRRAQEQLAERKIGAALDARLPLTFGQYENLAGHTRLAMAGVRDQVFDHAPYREVYDAALDGRGLLVLDRIEGFHRSYRWS
ncbi:hydroxymethylglutaryl-CoA synthase family protein [Streptomyces sp. KLOTTS4A1]|uniref:hydroxymethylglutaryl-CoA synthase family protein n=1 Tax=Streptomyces sp. KLOTTS4A1 TaxID=3390996 RepID=UPI0039F54AD6